MKRSRTKMMTPYAYISPAWLIIAAIVFFPIIYTVVISFTNMNIWHWKKFSFIGMTNYIKALGGLDSGFIKALLRTLLWTVCNISLQIVIALAVSLLLNTKDLMGRGIYKTILMISWAVPSYISALIWKFGMFQNDFGLLNQLLTRLGLEKVGWLNTNVMAFISCLMVNLWIALPYMILMFYGGLQGIDNGYYEAAEIEGASRWQKLRFITVPVLKPFVMPAIVMTTFITFKQFDIVYLMTMQTGAKTGADINTIITYAYENAFITNNYGYSSALSVIIFIIIIILTLLNKRNIQEGEE